MLIYDIETKTFNNKVDPNRDLLRTISMYDVDNDKTYFYTYKELEKIQKLFNKHKVIIGFNNNNYDDIILNRSKISLNYHINIDLLKIIRKRDYLLGVKDKSKSLSNLAKFFKLEHYKDDTFDYDILQKDEWTPKELKYIQDYNDLDIQVTYDLFKLLVEQFSPYKSFLKKQDIDNYSWLKSSISVYTYKVICNFAGIKEEYDDTTTHKRFKGAYVAIPTQKEAHGHIYCLDFASLYPHMYMMGNLFSPIGKGWSGDNFFKTFGEFKTDKLGVIETAIKTIYNLRKKLKKEGDKREIALKTVMNVAYGITANPTFKNVYKYDSARTCTSSI